MVVLVNLVTTNYPDAIQTKTKNYSPTYLFLNLQPK